MSKKLMRQRNALKRFRILPAEEKQEMTAQEYEQYVHRKQTELRTLMKIK